jgi:hypothetical protein
MPSLSSELTQQPIDVIKSGGGINFILFYFLINSILGIQVPLLIGTNEDEYSLFVCATSANITAAEYEQAINVAFPGFANAALQVSPLPLFLFQNLKVIIIIQIKYL